MSLTNEVHDLLSRTFHHPHDHLEFIDERGDGHHFLVRITSDQFKHKNRLERSRLVYALLDNFMKTDRIHALRLDLKTADERL